MIPSAPSSPGPVAASSSAASSRPLELLEARHARDELRSLLGAERAAAAEFLLNLSDFDRRRGWEPLGYASLFAFLRAELGLSKGGAFFRMTAARLIQRFPDVITPLREGKLCITTAVELAKVLSEQNQAEVLPRYFGLSSSEAREVTAAILPSESPPLRAVVTAIAVSPGRPPSTDVLPPRLVVAAWSVPDLSGAGRATLDAVQSTEPPRRTPVRDADRGDDVDPLTAELRRLHVTVSARLLKKLAAARDGLSHARPGATTEQVLEVALDLLLEKQARARGEVKRPRRTLATAAVEPPRTPEAPAVAVVATPEISAAPPPPRRASPRDAIPAAIRRAVWARDGGHCSWPLDGGGTCGSTHRLELDHLVPWALGGESTVGNLRVVCRAHNAAAARGAFGARVSGRYGSSA